MIFAVHRRRVISTMCLTISVHFFFVKETNQRNRKGSRPLDSGDLMALPRTVLRPPKADADCDGMENTWQTGDITALTFIFRNTAG